MLASPYFSGAQNIADDMVQRYSVQRGHYTPGSESFVIVHDSVVRHFGNAIKFKRRLSKDYHVVNAAGERTSISVISIANDQWKVSSRLADALIKHERLGEKVPKSVVASTFDIDKCLAHLRPLHIDVIVEDQEHGLLSFEIKNEKVLDAVIKSPWITFVDVARDDPKEETLNSFHDLNVNGFSLVHDQYPEFDGSTIAVSVRERTVEKSDIDLKGRILESSYEDPLISFHANQMATIIAGGGNTSPDSKGASWASRISSSSFESALPDEDVYFSVNGIKIQNHSYGYDIESHYGVEARAYDLQMNRDETLLHVFSAGNEGESSSSSGPYANIPSFATLTGNMKSAKNTLVVGGHYKDFSIDNRNSRGPAYDGRLKPEVVAYGPEGTSDAAAYVSGAAALLQHAYESKNGTLPNSALIRSVVSVTADDVHTEGIDFTTGFGALNAWKAIQVIQNENVFEGTIHRATTHHSFEIQVPENADQLRVVLAWNDPAAEAGASSALTHDLDLAVREKTSGNKWLPWVLNSFPHVDSLTKLPERKEDHLNNIEFVSIDDPAPGEYSFEISSGEFESQQKFHVAYWIEQEKTFEWQYPLSSTSLDTGAATALRWNTTFTGTGDVSMRVDGGEFLLLEGGIDLSSRFYNWVAPESAATVQFKVQTEGYEFLSPEVFVSPIQNIQVGFQCTDESMLFWNRSPGATQYTLYELGDKFMEPIPLSNDTSYLFTPNTTSGYFAVAAEFAHGRGRRGITQYFRSLGVGCYSRSFTATLVDDVPVLTINLSTAYNVREVRFEKRIDRTYVTFDIVEINNGLNYAVTDNEFNAGVLEYRAVIVLDDGTEIIMDPATLLFAADDTYLVYPNPVGGASSPQLNVLSDGKDIKLELLDANGKAIATYDVVGMLFMVDVSDFAPGLYFYRFSRRGEIVKTGRYLVQR